ncbi:3'-5' exonuclease [Nocardioides euryhalodurans]|uniref:3'-5' exonuclease n=1 Tax=Nocardioides euryhalodurans TaxID=2518370 RepID=UPI001ABEBFE7|nr:3'-5' exonuclease [Nocardioides euryhalodurans]
MADLSLLAVDLETSGLDPATERVLAIGFVPVDGFRVPLGGARRLLVGGDGGPGAAVVIHGLTHDDLATGRPLPEVLAELRAALEGRVLLAHHAPFDVAFLRAAFGSVGEELPDVPVVCTMDLQRRLLTRGGGELPRGALRLWRARDRFGLPPVRAHDALGDALACAELYLAQVAELGAAGTLTLADVRRREPSLLRRLRRRWRRWRWARRRSRVRAGPGVSGGSR